MKLSTFIKAVKEGTKVIAKQQVRAFNTLDAYQKYHYIHSTIVNFEYVGKLMFAKNKKDTLNKYLEFVAVDALLLMLDGTYEKLLKHGKEHETENALELTNAIQKAFKEEEAKETKSSKTTQSQ